MRNCTTPPPTPTPTPTATTPAPTTTPPPPPTQQKPNCDDTPNPEYIEYITLGELQQVLKRIGTNKAAGLDKLPSIIFKAFNKTTLPTIALHLLLNRFINLELWHPKWNQLEIAPILKPGKTPTEAASYRPIHLTSVMGKLLAQIIENKLQKLIPTCPEQMGFTPHYGTRDNNLIMQTIISKYRNQGVHCAFVDFKAAFDSIDRTLLLEKLRKTNKLPLAILTLIANMHSDVTAKVKGDTLDFIENIGVKQGDPLRPIDI